MFILLRFEQFLNVEDLMDVIEFGIDISDKYVHPSKALSPIVNTELGIEMLVRPVHPRNALKPIFVIVLGRLH